MFSYGLAAVGAVGAVRAFKGLLARMGEEVPLHILPVITPREAPAADRTGWALRLPRAWRALGPEKGGGVQRPAWVRDLEGRESRRYSQEAEGCRSLIKLNSRFKSCQV